MVDRILEVARNGMVEALKRTSDSAERLSHAFTPEETGEPVSDMIEMKLGSLAYQANAKVVKIGDELNESVLDLLA